MKPAAARADSWTWRTWGTVVLVLLLLHGAGLWKFGRGDLPAPRPIEAAPEWSWADRGAEDWVAWFDPTFFVHGHPQSFSGPGWMLQPRVGYSAPLPLEPPRFLEPAQLVREDPLRLLVRAAAWTPSVMSLRASASPQFGSLAPREPLTLRSSRLRIVPAGPARRLRQSPEPLPGWPSAELLTNSVVRLLVDGAGRVLTAALLVSSGLPAADQKALEVARQLEFEPDSGIAIAPKETLNLTPVLAVFEWQTLPPDRLDSTAR